MSKSQEQKTGEMTTSKLVSKFPKDNLQLLSGIELNHCLIDCGIANLLVFEVPDSCLEQLMSDDLSPRLPLSHH